MTQAEVVAFVSTDETMKLRRHRKELVIQLLAGSKSFIEAKRLKTSRTHPMFSIEFDEPLHRDGLLEDDIATVVRAWIFTEYQGKLRYRNYFENSVGRWAICLENT